VGAVLVHIDLDGDRPHPSSLAALAAGRAVASSWGATLYAALVIHDASTRGAPDSTPQVGSSAAIPGVEKLQIALARRGADKVVIALTDAPVLPLWGAIGGAWQGVLDHLRPRLVLFGSDSPSAAELGPRTGARIGARLLMRARAVGVEDVELRDHDGGYVRASDGGAAVVLVGGPQPAAAGDDDVDLVVLLVPGGADARIELAGSSPAEVAHSGGAVVAIGDDVVDDANATKQATRLAALLGAHVVGGTAAARAGTVGPGGVIERGAPLAPEVCVLIGSASLDLAGATSLVRIGSVGGKGTDGALPGPVGPNLAELCRALEHP
jgi:electron transfer flavoprotein alpha subunit